VIKVEPGGRVLLRIINSSAMSAYHIDLGSLGSELTAVDGFAVAPIKGRNFPIAVAQRLDIRLVIPRAPAAHPVLAVLEGDRKQTGIILAAGNAPVARIPDLAKAPSNALTLDLEGRLRALRPLTPRKADRVHTINLTGDMARYIWSLNNVAWTPSVPPLPIANGERVELVLVNQTGCRTRCICTVMNSRSSRSTASAFQAQCATPSWSHRAGVWWWPSMPTTRASGAFHCHLLYHLDAGMFTTFRYM
jgi:FtsP/CotA-like multicopper oxidase with cupredoxin domain